MKALPLKWELGTSTKKPIPTPLDSSPEPAMIRPELPRLSGVTFWACAAHPKPTTSAAAKAAATNRPFINHLSDSASDFLARPDFTGRDDDSIARTPRLAANTHPRISRSICGLRA